MTTITHDIRVRLQIPQKNNRYLPSDEDMEAILLGNISDMIELAQDREMRNTLSGSTQFQSLNTTLEQLVCNGK